LTTLDAAAERSKSVEIAQEAKECKKAFRDVKTEFERIGMAKVALARDPTDSAANLAVGRFLCLFKDDWAHGLPLLNQSFDATFTGIARLELKPRKDGADQLELADRWWTAATKPMDALKPRFEKRAIHWYEAALPGLEGLSKVRVEKLVD